MATAAVAPAAVETVGADKVEAAQVVVALVEAATVVVAEAAGATDEVVREAEAAWAAAAPMGVAAAASVH